MECACVCSGNGLFLGNSMPIRDMDMYAAAPAADPTAAATMSQGEVHFLHIRSCGLVMTGSLCIILMGQGFAHRCRAAWERPSAPTAARAALTGSSARLLASPLVSPGVQIPSLPQRQLIISVLSTRKSARGSMRMAATGAWLGARHELHAG